MSSNNLCFICNLWKSFLVYFTLHVLHLDTSMLTLKWCNLFLQKHFRGFHSINFHLNLLSVHVHSKLCSKGHWRYIYNTVNIVQIHPLALTQNVSISQKLFKASQGKTSELIWREVVHTSFPDLMKKRAAYISTNSQRICLLSNKTSIPMLISYMMLLSSTQLIGVLSRCVDGMVHPKKRKDGC